MLFVFSFSIISSGGIFGHKKKKEPSTMDRVKRQFESISVLLEQADQKKADGKKAEAQRLYGATIAAYQDFHRKFPSANTEIIKFRIGYCRNQLIKLMAAENENETKHPLKTTAKYPRDYVAVISANTEFLQAEKYNLVISNMRAFLKKYPKSSHAYLLLSGADVGLGNLKAAMKDLKKSLELDPNSADAHYNLCQLLVRSSKPDFKSARIHYKKAVKLGATPDGDLEMVLNL